MGFYWNTKCSTKEKKTTNNDDENRTKECPHRVQYRNIVGPVRNSISMANCSNGFFVLGAGCAMCVSVWCSFPQSYVNTYVTPNLSSPADRVYELYAWRNCMSRTTIALARTVNKLEYIPQIRQIIFSFLWRHWQQDFGLLVSECARGIFSLFYFFLIRDIRLSTNNGLALLRQLQSDCNAIKF